MFVCLFVCLFVVCLVVCLFVCCLFVCLFVVCLFVVCLVVCLFVWFGLVWFGLSVWLIVVFAPSDPLGTKSVHDLPPRMPPSHLHPHRTFLEILIGECFSVCLFICLFDRRISRKKKTLKHRGICFVF